MSLPIFLLESSLLPLLLLFATFVLTASTGAVLHLGRIKSKEILKQSAFFFRPILKKCFPRYEWDAFHASIGLSKTIYQLLYSLSGFFFFATNVPYFQTLLFGGSLQRQELPPLILVAVFVLFTSLIVDFLARLISSLWPKQVLKSCIPFTSFYLLLAFPIVGFILQLTRGMTKKTQAEEETAGVMPSRAQIKELIRESELQQHLDSFDQKLISSFINFKERVAKEIMVPRVDLFSLPAETPLRDAVRLFAREGYSRVPIYRDSLDHIVGVVLYKDLLKVYAEQTSLDAPLESILKPVLYAPENKRIAQLLQEFRLKYLHMAIVVDEYGGTEGIVTIEDILEELVGEIEDEYDIGTAQQFLPLPGGGWVVDAKMSILDIEEQLGIRIPSDPEYETIGGYIFHRAGTIPVKGWRLLHDEFDLEVLSSNERSIKKIKITPHPRKPE